MKYVQCLGALHSPCPKATPAAGCLCNVLCVCATTPVEQWSVKPPYDPDQHLPNEYLIWITGHVCPAFDESLIDTLELLTDRRGLQMSPNLQ